MVPGNRAVAQRGGVGIPKAWCGPNQPAITLAGTATDALRRPLGGVVVTLRSENGLTIAEAVTDEDGKFRLAVIAPGKYALTMRKKGFKPSSKIIISPDKANNYVQLVLESEKQLTLPVRATELHRQNGLSPTGTNRYTLTEKDIANLPEGEATPLNDVMLQMPGVALDQRPGRFYIRGEHMGIQYQTNGIMLPLDINTDPTFIQLLNATLVKSVSLLDGVLPAQYGYRTAGVIDIQTKDGCGDTHNNATMLGGGQRDTAQANFQLSRM